MKKLFGILLLLLGVCIFLGILYDKGILNGVEFYIIDDKVLDGNNELIIDNIETFNQYPDYPTGCESVSLYLLLRHYDIDVSVDDIISTLNKGPVPYGDGEILDGANPEKEFVGNPYLETSYGVFEKPIRDAANQFKKGAISKKGATLDDVENIIKSNNPLIAWIRTKENYEEIEYAKPWLDYNTKEEITWIRFEHAVLVYGYNEYKIFISNPYNGKKYGLDKELFKYNFDMMGGRIVYYN